MENNKQIQINSFDELLKFIEENELTDEQIKVLLENSLGVYYAGFSTKEKLIKQLKKYWDEYQGMFERPLFIDDLPESLKD